VSAPEVTIRRAESGDLGAIVDLLADDPLGAGRETAARALDRAYAEAFQAVDADPNQLLVVVERAGHIVGCLHLSFVPGLTRRGMWRGQIKGVRVATDERNSGLGRRLFEWAIQRCRESGYGLVQLTTDKTRPDAHRFYESFGFTASREGMKLALDDKGRAG